MRVSLLTVFRTAGKHLVQRFGSDNDILPFDIPTYMVGCSGASQQRSGLMAMVVGDGWIKSPGGG